MIKIIDKPTTKIWKGIKRIEIKRHSCRFWRYRNKNKLEYKDKRKIESILYYLNTKNSFKRKIRKKIDVHSGKRYHPTINMCKYCKKEFLSKQGKKQLFCSTKHKQKHFNDKFKYIFVRKNGEKILLHRYVVESHLHRKLKSDEIIHHKNNDIFDNDIANLQIMNYSDHKKIHMR